MSRTPIRTTAAASQSGQPALNPQLAVVPNFLHVPANSAEALESYLHLYVDGAARDEAALTAGRLQLN
jgi:hypothetical protein